MMEPWMIQELRPFYEEEMDGPLDEAAEKKINDAFNRWLCVCWVTNEEEE